MAGAVTATVGLGAVVYAIVRAPEVGWNSAQTWQVLAGAVMVLGVFVAIQAVHRAPLMPLSIFRTPNLGAANVAQLLLGGAWIPMWFFLNLYLQQVLGYSAFLLSPIPEPSSGIPPAYVERSHPTAMEPPPLLCSDDRTQCLDQAIPEPSIPE